VSTDLITATIAATVAVLLTAFLEWRKKIQTRRSLLTAFATELVQLFSRAVKIYRLTSKNGWSRSNLYVANDADTLGRLASVYDAPDLINAIIQLKERYFQIQIHVQESLNYLSGFAYRTQRAEMTLVKIKQRGGRGVANPQLQFDEEKHREEATYFEEYAKVTQKLAMEFFPVEDMISRTQTFLRHAQKYIKGNVGNKLEAQFLENAAEALRIKMSNERRRAE